MPRPEPGAALAAEADLPAFAALRRHWPEYAVEGGFLGLFVLAAGIVSAWLQAADGDAPAWRHVLAGVVPGLLLMAMIYSPWGRRSGSHMNPAITLAYLRLGKMGRWDGVFYILAQVAGALAAVLLLRSGALLPPATAPSSLAAGGGPSNPWLAWAAQFLLSAAAMLLILFTSNHASWFRWTGVAYGLLAMLVVACVSPLAMQIAIEGYRLLTGRTQVLCAKLAHNTHGRCIFRCMHPYQTRALAMEAIRRRADERD